LSVMIGTRAFLLPWIVSWFRFYASSWCSCLQCFDGLDQGKWMDGMFVLF
jgi:hypothetical protein